MHHGVEPRLYVRPALLHDKLRAVKTLYRYALKDTLKLLNNNFIFD